MARRSLFTGSSAGSAVAATLNVASVPLYVGCGCVVIEGATAAASLSTLLPHRHGSRCVAYHHAERRSAVAVVVAGVV